MLGQAHVALARRRHVGDEEGDAAAADRRFSKMQPVAAGRAPLPFLQFLDIEPGEQPARLDNRIAGAEIAALRLP